MTLLEELRKEILEQLEQCEGDKVNTPKICELISTEEGKKKVVDYIVHMVADGGQLIAESIRDIEYDFSNNKIDL